MVFACVNYIAACSAQTELVYARVCVLRKSDSRAFASRAKSGIPFSIAFSIHLEEWHITRPEIHLDRGQRSLFFLLHRGSV